MGFVSEVSGGIMKRARLFLNLAVICAVLGLTSCASPPRNEASVARQAQANPCGTSPNWFAISSAYLTPGPGGFPAEQTNVNGELARERQEQLQCQLALAQEKAAEAAQATLASTQEASSGSVQTEPYSGGGTDSSNMRCRGQYSVAWNNCVGTVHYANGNVYDGEFQRGRRSGYGVLVINAIGVTDRSSVMARVPSIYVGEFEGNRLNGTGVVFEKMSHVAHGGTFVDNLPSGPYKRVSCDAASSSSTWNDCFGVVRYPNGNIYLGEFKNGERSGLGVIKIMARGRTTAQNIATPTPGLYVGQFRGGLMNGRGVLLTQNSGVFGRFVDNRYVGQ